MYSMELVYRAGLALGGLSLAVFFLGVTGHFSPALLVIVLAAAASAFIYSCKGVSFQGLKGTSFAEKLLLAACVISIVSILPLALMPPSVRDELIQHLALPKLYIGAGRIWEIRHIGFSYLPQNIDLLYLIPLALGNDIVPRLVHLLFAVMTAALVYSFILPRAGRAYALIGFLIYMTTPLVFNLSRMAYIDHGAAFYSMLSFMAALRFRDEGALKWLAVSAVAVGLGLGAKYNVLISFFLIGLFILAVSYKARGFATALRNTALYGLIALAVLSPWLIRNYAWTGSPFYPLFETAAASVARGEGLHVTGEMAPVGKRFLLYGEGALDLIILPLRLFWEGADNSIEKFDGVLNPFFLVFIPLAFLKKEKDAKLLLAFSFFFFMAAALTVDLVTRYLMPVIPVVIMLVTLGIRNAFGSRALKWPAVFLAVALVAFNASYASGLYRKTGAVSYFAAGMDREEYLKERLPDYDTVSFGNCALPQGSKVMLLFTGDRGYYWDRDYIYGDRTGMFLKALVKGARDAGALAAGFKSYGATHLMVNEALFQKFANDNFTEDELKVLVSFFNTRLETLYTSRGYSLFKIL
jgi:hypothetical protein